MLFCGYVFWSFSLNLSILWLPGDCMVDKKLVVASEVVSVMSKITNHKLNGLNNLDWSKTIRLYLWSVDMDNHLVEDPPTDDSKQ